MGQQNHAPESFRESFLFSSRRGSLFFAICAGIISYVFSISVLFVPGIGLILSNFSSLPIFLSGFTVGAWGAVISGGVVLLMGALTGNTFFPLLITCITMGFIIIVTRQSLLVRDGHGVRFFYPEGRLIVFLLMSALLFLGSVIFGVKAFFLEKFSEVYHSKVSSFQEVMFLGVSYIVEQLSLKEQVTPDMISLITTYGPSFFLLSWVVTLFINASLALEALKKMGYSLRPPFRMVHIELPYWYPWLLLGSVGLIFMGGDFSYLGKNASILIIAGFIFQGCAVVHSIIQKRFEKDKALQKIVLGFFYGSMIVLPWFLIVAGLGILDQFMYLKKRALE